MISILMLVRRVWFSKMGEIELLVVNDGARYLDHEDQLLSQIVRGFVQLDPVRFVKFTLIPLGQSFQQV